MKKFGLYINGQYVHSDHYTQIKCVDPRGDSFEAQFSTLKSKDQSSEEIYEAALLGAQATLEQVRKGFFPLKERIEFLRQLHREIEKSEENLARVLAGDISKPISLARAEVQRCKSTIQATLASADEIAKNRVLNGNKLKGFCKRVPIGVTLAITPFNFPLNLAIHKIAPAILSGCPVIFKPSDKALLSSVYLVDLCHGAKLPAGMLNYLNCENEITSKLCADNRIAHTSFTGSAHVGWNLKKLCAGTCTLELGGNAPVYIDESADLETAVEATLKGAFSYSGQVCISVQNIFVHNKIEKDFNTLVKDKINDIAFGDIFNDQVLSSYLITPEAKVKTQELIESLKRQGAKELATSNNFLGQENQSKEDYIAPTLFSNIPLKDNFFCNEVFAPIASVNTVASFTEFLESISSFENRLQCGIFSNNKKQKERAINELDYGGIIINQSPMQRIDSMPYGGQGKSGLGREGPLYAIEDYTTWKVFLEAEG